MREKSFTLIPISAFWMALGVATFPLTGCATFNSLFAQDEGPADAGADVIDEAADRISGGSPSQRLAQKAVTDTELEERIAKASSMGQIVTGMRSVDVQRVWGEPTEVEIAGEAHAGNERWVYRDGVSSYWGLKPTRHVYFEAGRVVGWRLNP